MKKRFIPLIVLAASIFLAGAGCSNHNIDTAKVRAAFPGIDGEAKVQLEAGLAAIDASNYIAALKPLDKVKYELKMDKKQWAILDDTLKKVHAKALK
ncbi:MAG TPA: hypothetical protein VH619_00290 [Verrucomicrobiae bacterium]|jgi:hypothetical protein|nr:hypothetical protein [Verrucomicrobiae bacterium]